ncbi:MAG: phosphatidate cytidylyltransferase [Nitrospinaceae bacterium]
MKRVLSGALSIPLVLGIVLYGSPWLFFALVAAVVLAGCYEYFSMISRIGIDGFPFLGGALSVLLLVCFYFGGRYLLSWGAVAVLALFLAWMFREKNVRTALDQIAYTLLGVVYVGGLAGYVLMIRGLEGGRHWLLFLFLVIWLGDIAAYYGGKSLGKRALAPSVSPNKTREGALFGLAGSLAGGMISVFWLLDGVSLLHGLLIALICGMIGQLGDLAESLLKRNTGVKDSGGLFPGHGGVLDRIDSLLFAGPALFVYHQWVL